MNNNLILFFSTTNGVYLSYLEYFYLIYHPFTKFMGIILCGIGGFCFEGLFTR
jgi:hypothetical protein